MKTTCAYKVFLEEKMKWIKLKSQSKMTIHIKFLIRANIFFISIQNCSWCYIIVMLNQGNFKLPSAMRIKHKSDDRYCTRWGSIGYTRSSYSTRWQSVQKIAQEWRMDCQYQLQVRCKWNEKRPIIKVGELVMIKDMNLPFCKWPMGRFVQLHHGDDGMIRVVTVKTTSNVLEYGITELAPLPIK